jgi:hypothetical protein
MPPDHDLEMELGRARGHGSITISLEIIPETPSLNVTSCMSKRVKN